MLGVPHTKSRTLFDGEGTCCEMRARSMRPRRPSHPEPSGSRVSVCTIVRRPCEPACHALSASRAMTSLCSRFE